MKRALRIIAIAVGVVVVLAIAGVAAIKLRTHWLLSKTFTIDVKKVAAVDETALARGEHLATVVLACRECHGGDFSGRAVIDEQPVGRVTAPNITSGKGGVVAAYSDEDWARIIRHGVTRDGRPALLMPSTSYAVLTPEDLAATIYFLRHVPPVDNTPPPIDLGPIGHLLVTNGGLHVAAHHIDHQAVEDSAMTDVRNNEQLYLSTIASCSDCHVGREVKPGVIAPLRTDARMQRYDHDSFAKAVRTGTNMDGRVLNPLMPYASFSGLTDHEIDVLYGWLKNGP